MLDKMSERARLALKEAKELVIKLKNDNIDTVHVLQGIWNLEASVATNALKNLGLRTAALKKAMLRHLKQGEKEWEPGAKIPFSPAMQEAFAQALEAAKELGHNVIGTEHLLLGIVSVPGSAQTLLGELNVTLEAIQKELISLFGEKPPINEEPEYKDAPSKTLNPKQPSLKKAGKETPHIDKYCIDLTEQAQQGKLDPCIGRLVERKRVFQILGRKTKNNPVLIGEPGVGKSKIVEGLAQDIAAGNVPEVLRHKRIIAVDLASMVAGTKYRGQFEERIKGLIKEVQDVGNVILFLDELHTIVGAGGSEGGMDAANIMKPALARGELHCIGSTTLDEYRKHIEKDGALERRFQSIIVDPPSVHQTVSILKGLQSVYEKHHGVKYTDEALRQAAVLSDKYVSDRYLPDKALDVVDEAGSRARMDASFKPEKLQEFETRLQELDKAKTDAVRNQEFEKAAKLRDEYVKLETEAERATEEWKTGNLDAPIMVDEDSIAEIVASMTGVPLTEVTEEEGQRLLRIEEELHRSVVGQEGAITRIAQAIRRARAGLKNPKRPSGSFLFVGPTGVGKTLLCKSLAKFLFGSEEHLIQLDMSEYMEKHSVSRLVGAPPGYVGYEEGGQLTEKVRRKPYSVVLLDEIEKAHPDIFNMLLQIMEEGRLTDSFGRAVNFRNTILIMTSNLGSDLLKSTTSLGFTGGTKEEQNSSSNRKMLMEAVEKAFRPEFINRLDDVVVFEALTRDHMRTIIDIELKDVVSRLTDLDLTFDLTEEAKAFLLEQGWSEVYGARPLKRAIERFVENPLSEQLLAGKFKGARSILVTPGNDELLFEPQINGEKHE